MWYGSRAIDEYSVTDKKGRNQIKSRYVICLVIDACLTINTQNNKINKKQNQQDTHNSEQPQNIVFGFITMGVFIIFL
jgi:hypothetical protein